MSLFIKKCTDHVRWLLFCVLLSSAASARAEMVATFSKPIYQGLTLEFQFSNLSSPLSVKAKSECAEAGRLMVWVLAYDPNRPFNGWPYASGCWYVAGSMIAVNSKNHLHSEPFNLSIPVSKAVTTASFTAWSDYKINRSRKNPPEKIILAAADRNGKAQKAKLDLLPETVAYTSYDTMLGATSAIQLLDKYISSSYCPVEGAVKLAIFTRSTVAGGTVPEEGAEVCWYVDVEGMVKINGYLPSSKNTFHREVKKADLTLTNAFKVWPEPCTTAIAVERFRCRYWRQQW